MRPKSDDLRPDFEASTLVELLIRRSQTHPDKVLYTFVSDVNVEQTITYGQLDRQARALGAYLQSLGASGQQILLIYPPGPEFITAFFACLYAEAVAVPTFPPRPHRSLLPLQALAVDAQATVALTTEVLLSRVSSSLSEVPALQSLRWIATDKVNPGDAEEWREPHLGSTSLAFLQYTSGSTAMPKGVMVTHGNVLNNARVVHKSFEINSESRGVFWLPFYHDMGLMGGLLQPVYSGAQSMLLPPLTFLQRPFLWLQSISSFKATISGGPNFSYDLCVDKITQEERDTLDLSSWEVAFNGAEPIRHETLERFAAKFASCGFRREAFYPCYGVAEATLIVSGGAKTAPPRAYTVRDAPLEHNQVSDVVDEREGTRTLVSSGHPALKTLIVDPESFVQCRPDQVGEIWLKGPTVAQGYWRRPEETERAFHAHVAETGEGPFLRTGDLGFLKDGELFVTGRIKDLIIVRGRNYYPQDIELTVEQSHEYLRATGCAAFSVEAHGEERLVIVAEVGRHYRNVNLNEVIETIRSQVGEHHELQVYALVLIKPGTLPRTSSGKLQRFVCREKFLMRSLEEVAVWTSGLPTQPDDKSAVSFPSPVTGPAASTEADGSHKRADDLIDWLRSYANERINSQLIDERRTIPPYIVLDLGNRGILGMEVPEKYGGIALDTRDAMRIVEQLAAIDLTLASFVGVNNVLGIRPILHYANTSTRDELLPPLARGRELAAFAITEPGAGSNPRAISSAALPTAEGGWRLRGQKVWIGSGSWAGVINVFVKLADSHDQSDGMSGFVVRQGAPGLRHGPEALTMGVRGMVQNSIFLDDVPVSASDLLGKQGEGFEVAQDAMMFGRLGLGAMSVGGMKRCAQLMLRYATRRDVATGRLLDNPVTLVRLSNLTAAITATETLVGRIAALTDAGQIVPLEAFVACKTSGPEFLWTAADMHVQLLGARGYVENNVAPQLLRDARLLRIFEGPTETLEMFLGSSVIHGSPELYRFLGDVLHAPNVAASLRETVLEINSRTMQIGKRFADLGSARRWAASLAGQVATSALLWAVVEEAAVEKQSGHLRRAVDWTRLRFEEIRARALSGTPGEAVLLDSRAATDLISSYGETIGDLEQSLAGEEQGLDPLLRRESSTRPFSQQPVASTSEPKELATEAQRQRPRIDSATATPIGFIPPSAAVADAAGPAPALAPVRSGEEARLNLELLSACEAGEQQRIVQSFLRERLAHALTVPLTSVDVHRPLFSLGMDSLVAVEFKNRIEESFGVNLPVATFLEDINLIQLATRIRDRVAPPSTTSSDVHKPSSESHSEHPLSQGQKALWFLHQVAPESTAYNVALGFEIKGPVDESVLRWSIQALVDRHPSLRTTFVSRDGEPLQRVQEQLEACFQVIDSAEGGEGDFIRRIDEETQRPFSLTDGPLFRAFLFNRSAQPHVLLLVFHHIIEDAWSLNIILTELARLYSARTAGIAPDLPPLSLQYADYVRRQMDALSGPEGQRLWDYWRAQLGGELPVLNLPADHPRPPIQTYRGTTHTVRISSTLSQKLKVLSETHGATLYVTLLAAFQVLLHRYTSQEDILVGSPMIGRNRAELAGLVGYFVNPVVLRANLAGNPPFSDFLRQTRHTVLAALEHQDFPFPLLVERLQPQRDPGRSPLFQVAFTLQKDLPDNLSLSSSQGASAAPAFDRTRLEPWPLKQHFAQFDLSLMVTERKSELDASFEYNVDLFNEGSIERMAGHFKALLEAIVADPATGISHLPLLTRSEEQQLTAFEAGTQPIAVPAARPGTAKEMAFSLFYFSCNDAEFAADKYRLLLEGAQFADQHGFAAVWTPERHFNAFGGIYPNPSVIGAALAMITQRIRIRAGSVVLPLHHPIRVAEEWSVVDNLSGGRVDLAFATGWNAGDFVLAPANHANRKEVMFSGMETVRRLWRGETVSVPNVAGETSAVRIYPLPMQRELPVWIACAGNTETFAAAGSLGVNVLTTLLLQSVDELAERISLYRAARAQNGHDPAAGRVTLMLHTFVGEDLQEVRRQVYRPFTDYLKSSVELWRHESKRLDELTDRQRADLLEYSFERYFQTSALFGTPETCSRMVERLTAIEVDEIACLIDFGVTNDQVISNLPFLNVLRERSEVAVHTPEVEIRSPVIVDPLSVRCIHELIEARAALSPDAIAVSFGSEQIGYGELNRRANQLAHFLRNLGVGQEKLVGLMAHRSIEMVVGLLGILKAGGAYVPLDPSYPQERLSFMLDDARLSVVLTQERLVESLSAKDLKAVRLDADWEVIAKESEQNPSSGVTADHLAYVIYTSGSTGRPKGVEVPHRAVVNLLRSVRDEIGLTDQDSLLAVTTLSFDIAALELFLPLTVGARIDLASREVATDGALLKQRLEISKPTVMQATPATWRMLLTAGWSGSRDLKVLCGGEALSRELADQLVQRSSACWNLYGPTETTIWSLIHRVETGRDGAVPIGRPLDNTQVFVLDSHLQRAPIGVPGELYIGGAGLARGYLRRSDLTAERFIPHPFDSGKRLYRTGDIVRYLPDGDLEFRGRVDQQVKVRGYRVELGEIESALAECPAISEAVVLSREDASGEQHLVAYVVARNGEQPSSRELHAYLQEKLPEWMLPSSFVTLQALPLTPNGKVNRSALPKPEHQRSDLGVDFVAPRTELERTIAGIWQEVLQVDRVGLHDNFFDLGGHSLLLARVHSRIRENLGREVPMVDLYRYPTIDSLTRHLTGEQRKISLQETQDRAEGRRESLQRLRQVRRSRGAGSR